MVEIENAHRLTDLFGHWPDFHDAEILALRLDTSADGDARLEVDVEIAEMSDEIDERGYYRTRQRCRATLRFDGVLNARIDGFRRQNVLDAFEASALSPEDRRACEPWGERRYRVRFLPIGGFCEVELLCDSLAVLTATAVVQAI
jgi:hypothetical protein